MSDGTRPDTARFLAESHHLSQTTVASETQKAKHGQIEEREPRKRKKKGVSIEILPIRTDKTRAKQAIYKPVDQSDVDDPQTPSTPPWPIDRSHKTLLDDNVNSIDIAVVLRRNDILIDDDDLKNILTTYEKKRAKFIDELCDGYQNEKDESIPLCKALQACQTEMLLDQRQIFYDTVLKEHIYLRELQCHNFVKILKKTIMDMKFDFDSEQLEQCAQIAKKNKLKGKLFFKTLEDDVDSRTFTDNKEYKTREQFADVFKAMKNVTPKIWMRIYRRIVDWRTKHYQKIDFSKIGGILKMDGFMKQTEISALRTKLKNEKVMEAKEEKAYNKGHLLHDLCRGIAYDYEEKDMNEADDVDEEEKTEALEHAHKERDNILRSFLEDELKWDNKKRRILYDVLLHKYFQNHQLDHNNFYLILTDLMRELDRSHRTDEAKWKLWNANKAHVLETVWYDRRIDGRIVIKGRKFMSNAKLFVQRFVRGEKPKGKRPVEPDEPLLPTHPYPEPKKPEEASDESEEMKDKYDKEMEQYEQTKDNHEYKQKMATYDKEKKQYDKDMKIYDQKMNKYLTNAEQYDQKMEKFNADNISRRTLAGLYRAINKWETKYQNPEDEQNKEKEAAKARIVVKEKTSPPVYMPKPDEKIPLVISKNKEDPNQNHLPKYIHKTIWYQSWDENIESLTDRAVSALCNKTKFWNDKKFVELIYDDHQFYYAVTKVFKEMGETKFFEHFVKENYERETSIWRIALHRASVIDEAKLLTKIAEFEFPEFDFDGDKKITRREFADCIAGNGIRVDRNYVDQIFDKIDDDNSGTIEVKELTEFAKKHKEDPTPQPRLDDNAPTIQFKWDNDCKTCVIGHVGGKSAPLKEKEGFEWHAYVSIPPNKRKQFEKSHPHEHIKRYWKNVNDPPWEDPKQKNENEEEEQKHESMRDDRMAGAEEERNEHLDEKHLNQIFAVLNYYYTTPEAHDDTPLPFKKRDRENNHFDIQFIIEDHRYELKWWNQRGRSEPTAIAIQTQRDDARDTVIYYLRFKAKREELEWRWYDVNSQQYRPMGQYTDKETKEQKTDHKLIAQLEASFLGNDYQHFDPKELEDINKDIDLFNSCWLSKLSKFLEEKINVQGADMFVFSATFDDKSAWKIVSMEQVGYTHREKSAYRRNIARMIRVDVDGKIELKNSLLQMSANQDSFVQRWKSLFKLFEEEQQMYFWSFILAIVTQIKYIDIEFENQMVLLPLRNDDGSNVPTQSIISRLIDCYDVQREHRIAIDFDGYLVPPSKEWQEGETGDSQTKSNKVSKTDTLRRAKPKGKEDHSDDECRWVQDEEDFGRNFQFDRHESVILRMADVIRKFMLEFEMQKKSPLWPWYNNSKYCNNKKGVKLYNELMNKFNFAYEFDGLLTMYRKEQKGLQQIKVTQELIDEENKQETDKSNASHAPKPTDQCIRHKRKFAAIQLLKHHTHRNLHYLRHYLTKARDRWKEMEKQQKEIERKKREMEEKRDENETAITEMDNLIRRNAEKLNQNEIAFWKQFIKDDDVHASAHVPYLNEDLDTFSFFKKFMMQCFVKRDYQIYERNKKMHEYTAATDFYRIFIDSWRKVPSSFWQYKHDILLMELVVNNGIKSNAIVEYIGKKGKELTERYEFKDPDKVDTTTHPLYAFQSWCREEINVLHRVQHVLKTIMFTLHDSNASNTKYAIFPSYQKKWHLEFIGRKDLILKKETKDDDQHAPIEEEKDAVDANENKAGEDQTQVVQPKEPKQGDVLAMNEIFEQHHKEEDREAFKIDIDRYITRDFETELFDSLQAFDLKEYGPIITRFIIRKLKREPEKSHCIVLGRLFYSLPDPIALEILWKSQYTLQRVQPETLKELCKHIEWGSLFKPSTCLSIAQFFDELKETDLVQRGTWEKYEFEFEQRAFEDVAKIENNHMIYMLLNAPLANHEGRCLIQLAQEQSRVSFLNTERISDVIHHMYRRGHLKIDETLKPKPKEFEGLRITLARYPFRFYLSPQGYHWVGGVLYVEYLLLLFAYAYYWPLRSDAMSLFVLEIVFWFSNLGYILYEFHEFSEKGLRQYFNLAMMGDANVMDAMIGITWVVLFATRVTLGNHQDFHSKLGDSADVDTNHHDNMDILEIAYSFVFGIAILLVTARSVKILGNSQYFGALILIIKTMFKEMLRFVLLYILMMVAVLFALRCMGDKAYNRDGDPTAWDELLYIFQLFISFKNIDDFDADFDPTDPLDDWIKIYLVIATLFGTLLLFNVLIALMVSKYELAKKQADRDVMLNRTEISFDLLRRSRHMPPPLNIVMYAFTFVVWCLNCIISLWSYANIDFVTKIYKKRCKSGKLCNCCRCCKPLWIYICLVLAIAWMLIFLVVILVFNHVISTAFFWILSTIVIFVSLCIIGICPDVRVNMFEHIHYGLFDKMRRLNIWKCSSVYVGIGAIIALALFAVGETFAKPPQLGRIRIASVIVFGVSILTAMYFKWGYSDDPYDYVSKYERDRGSQSNTQTQAEEEQTDDTKEKDHTPNNDKLNELEFFKSAGGTALFRWYWIEVSNALYVIFDIVLLMVNVFGFLDILVSLTAAIGGTSPNNDWYTKPDVGLRMLHKGCYGRIKRFSEDHTLSPMDGLSMSTYFEKYRNINKHSLPRRDKVELNKLTAQTLFCPHCYQPFLNTPEMIETQLASPLNALFDLMSAIVFVVVPIAWIPLLVVMFLGDLMDKIGDLFDISDRVNENYSNRDYDRNYFPNKIISHQNEGTVDDQVSNGETYWS